MKGIDVSENNGMVDWGAVKAAGFEFAIIRIGYGKGHLDSQFYDNVNGALKAGLKIGIYHYSYALSDDVAGIEADFVIQTLISIHAPRVRCDSTYHKVHFYQVCLHVFREP